MNYVVIKCGGSVFEQLPPSFYQDIVTIQQQGEWQPIIVHGGGPLISQLLEQTGVKSTFVNGLRVTTNEVLDVVEMALSGSMNKGIVRKIAEVEGKAIGVSGIDGNLLEAKRMTDDTTLGFVGEVIQVNTSLLESFASQGLIPVISPIGMDKTGQRYNINADMAASAVAQALEAKLCFISDIPGIYHEVDGEKQVFHQLNEATIEELIQQEVIFGGMIPKVKSALSALRKNVREVSIVDGTADHGLIEFMQGKQVGTRIALEQEVPYV
ncbi:N-acetylglutamate kinase [Gracilibacillus orientalis]|uniref:Acetylglutamate kinase n=1 Tax=Gracilibacillus orientalis TaxID=334253 RepID=A0A1I4JNN3_9BACI|nr:acetylglutamate kinase [Gracilibacillus orientalis]SFL68084.1 N-acetylglutamate kinase [Gracilibacillus orientalis]